MYMSIGSSALQERGQYAYGLVEAAFIDNEFYVPYTGDMILRDSVFCRGPIVSDSLTREVHYNKTQVPSKVCTMLEDRMSFCSEGLNNGEVVYISLSYTILDGEVDEVILPDGTVEARRLVPGNYHETYCFVPNKVLPKDTVHNMEELSVMVPDSLDIDRVGRDRIFERGFDLTYPIRITLNNKKDYFVNAPNVLYRGDEKKYLNRFFSKNVDSGDLNNDELLIRLSEYYSNKENENYGDFEDWNNWKTWNDSKDLKNHKGKKIN